MAKKEENLPDVDDDKNSPPPLMANRLQLEIESYEKKILRLERMGYTKQDTSLLWMEVAVRKDMYLTGEGKLYEEPIDVSDMEKDALKVLFRTLDGFKWSEKFAWIGLTKTMTTPDIRVLAASGPLYAGVETTKILKNVMTTGLDFTGFGCNGILPNEIGNFETLSKLDMRWNLLYGPLNEAIGQLKTIQEINFSGNMLDGSLTTAMFKQLDGMRILNLSNNYLSGTVCDFFKWTPRLEVLDLSNNMFHGALPASFATLNKLKVLKLQCNGFSGPIPTIFDKFPELTVVNLSNNRFGGNFSDCKMYSCTQLERVMISDNLLTGHLKAEIGNLTQLKILYLHRNSLRGVLPPEICQCLQLRRVNLSSNHFRGSLPIDLGNLIKLESLVLEDNAFIAPIPTSITKLKQLRDYSCFRNMEAEASGMPRGFIRKQFDQVHEFGPRMGLNSMCWDFDEHEEFPNPTRVATSDRFALFDQRLHPERRQYSFNLQDYVTLVPETTEGPCINTDSAVLKAGGKLEEDSVVSSHHHKHHKHRKKHNKERHKDGDKAS